MSLSINALNSKPEVHVGLFLEVTSRVGIYAYYGVSCTKNHMYTTHRTRRKSMAKAPMNTLQLSCIQIAIALFLFSQAKSATEARSAHPNDTISRCIAGERSALLSFRAGLSDRADLLSSWKGDDCCQWKGVFCGNNTDHVVKLDLPGMDCENYGESENVIVGNISSSLLGLQHLQYLDLSCNRFDKIQIPEFMGSLHKLRYLDLSRSGFIGSIPPQLGNLSNLSLLDLSYNELTGHVPQSIGGLTKLRQLLLESNNLDGVMHEGHFVGLDMLEGLILSDNSIAITVSPTWVPPFNLTEINLQSCHLGPKFPMWLRSQTQVVNLDISNTSINDMLPDWFWIAASSAVYLNIRNNNITGVLPSTMEFMRAEAIDVSANQLGGQIPQLPSNLSNLDLSQNNIVGTLPLELGAPRLVTLVLYDNMISGTIPPYLCKLQSLRLLDLSGNYLNGSITNCPVNEFGTNMASLSIEDLSLRDNNLSGEFPSILQKCPGLIFLDLGDNQFHGSLPAWIGEKLSSLSFLRLRSNKFYGHIPVEVGNLVNLQYLDLAYNNISGSIPRSIVNCLGMKQMRDYGGLLSLAFDSGAVDYAALYFDTFTVLTKGQEILYNGEITYMVNLDLSCNGLTGEVPAELTALVELRSLNLSWNNFNGKIPENIGALMQVESFDLSHNDLSGEIPSSLSALTSLSRLNLSYNNLSGRIPSGNQLQALEDQESIYFGNTGLCGPPLSRECSSQPDPTAEHHEDASGDVVSFLISMGSGYVMGVWVVFCTFLFKRKWRVSWYSLCDRLYDRAYVQVTVTWASLSGKING